MASALDFGAREAAMGSGMDIESGEATAKVESGGDMKGTEMERSFRAEIDTSAPFESVKEAVSRFGGVGYWKPYNLNKFSELEHEKEEVDIVKVEEHAVQLEKDLIMKERETLDVLKELESTNMIVEELKLKLQKEASDVSLALQANSDGKNMTCAVMDSEKENYENLNQNPASGLISFPSSAPGLILMELKQAKLNLTRTTTDLAGIRTSVDSLNKKLEKERSSLERTRERLTLNSSKISSLEEELSQTRLKLQQVEIKGDSTDDSPSDISREIQRLSSEAEEFKKTSEAARSEVLRALSEIEQTKTRIKTAEIRLFAARKMKQAARAAEAAAFAEIKCLSSHENSNGDSLQSSGVTLSIEEYSMLTSKAQEAEELSKKRVLEAMLQVDEANASKIEILKRVEEATEEVKTSKKTLEDALSRVEAANRGKLAVEEALRKWRSEHSQKRRSVHNSTKFKNPSHQRRESRLIDVNGLNLVSDDEPSPVLKPTLSIGQILSRKLLLPQELEINKREGMSSLKQKVSLGQMLNKQTGDIPAAAATATKVEKESGQKQFLGKRKKFGFARFSLLLTKQSKKKKKPTLNLR